MIVKKIAALLLTLLLTISLIPVNILAEENDNTYSEIIATTQSIPAPYKSKIEEYINSISTKNYDLHKLGDFGGGSWPMGSEALGRYGYYLIDLNNDGTDELLIGNVSEKKLTLASIYTIENTQPKQLAVQIGSDTELQ